MILAGTIQQCTIQVPRLHPLKIFAKKACVLITTMFSDTAGLPLTTYVHALRLVHARISCKLMKWPWYNPKSLQPRYSPSPTRRSFLSGRFPNHITTVQPDGANMCSNFLPLNFTILSEKLHQGGYKNYFIGKGAPMVHQCCQAVC